MKVELTIHDECDCSDNAEVEIMSVDTIKDIRSLVAFCQHFDSSRYIIDANEYKEPVRNYVEENKDSPEIKQISARVERYKEMM